MQAADKRNAHVVHSSFPALLAVMSSVAYSGGIQPPASIGQSATIASPSRHKRQRRGAHARRTTGL